MEQHHVVSDVEIAGRSLGVTTTGRAEQGV